MVWADNSISDTVEQKLEFGIILLLALDEVVAAQVSVCHARWHAAIVLQTDGLDTMEGLQVNFMHRSLRFHKDKAKPETTMVKERLIVFSDIH